MNINITLLIQATNFFLAYVMIRFLLFKPVVAILSQEWAEEKTLHTAIAQGNELITKKKHEQQDHWRECREYFKEHWPVHAGLVDLDHDATVPLEHPHIEQKHIHALQEEVTRALIDRIDHAH